MNIVLFDQADIKRDLLPLTFTRPIGTLRVGVFTIAEKWQKKLDAEISYITEPYLQDKFLANIDDDNLLINGAIIPDDALLSQINDLKMEEALVQDELLIAFRAEATIIRQFQFNNRIPDFKKITYQNPLTIIRYPWDIFRLNGSQIIYDFGYIQQSGSSENIADPFTRIYNEDKIFVESGAEIKSAVLNAENGPIYIGKNAKVQEGAVIRGPFSLGESAVVNMGAKIRGDSTVGPFSKVGGEISNSVIIGYSNKAHDGFMGNSVIGEWCNIGADTNTSNLKNNYAEIKVWNYREERFINSKQQFCGLIMGDHAKCGINTMFNTGTVVGISANVFGSGYPRTFIPSFSWGGASGFTTYHLNKVFEVADKVMKRRQKEILPEDKDILNYIFDITSRYRNWETNK